MNSPIDLFTNIVSSRAVPDLYKIRNNKKNLAPNTILKNKYTKLYSETKVGLRNQHIAHVGKHILPYELADF